MADTFSVVIPTRDRGGRLAEALTHLRTLDEAPDEVVVVDDGSRDDTVDVLASAGTTCLRWVSTSGAGAPAARNLGAELSTGDWIIFLDDDDIPDAGWQATFRALARSHPGAMHLSIGHRIAAGGRTIDVPASPLGPTFGDVTAGYMAGTFAVRRSLFESVGGFDPQLQYMEFTDLALRLLPLAGSNPRGVAVESSPHITIVTRPATERTSQRPTVLAASIRTVLERHRDRWMADPKLFASQLATLGVSEWRAGDEQSARHHLVEAWRRAPADPRHAARLVLSRLPGLAHRVWGNQ